MGLFERTDWLKFAFFSFLIFALTPIGLQDQPLHFASNKPLPLEPVANTKSSPAFTYASDPRAEADQAWVRKVQSNEANYDEEIIPVPTKDDPPKPIEIVPVQDYDIPNLQAIDARESKPAPTLTITFGEKRIDVNMADEENTKPANEKPALPIIPSSVLADIQSHLDGSSQRLIDQTSTNAFPAFSIDEAKPSHNFDNLHDWPTPAETGSVLLVGESVELAALEPTHDIGASGLDVNMPIGQALKQYEANPSGAKLEEIAAPSLSSNDAPQTLGAAIEDSDGAKTPSKEDVQSDMNIEELSRQELNARVGDGQDYEMPKSDEPRIVRGRDLLEEYSYFLTDLEYDYLVDREVIMGIWGIETNFGQNFGAEPVGMALSKYLKQRPDRRKFVQDQMSALTRLASQGVIDPMKSKSSFAGALGHTQFIPTSYEKFGADGNADGKVDLWNAKDALASTANYLHKHGWEYGKPWGIEVKLPDGFFSRADVRQKQPIEFWRAQGVVPMYDDNSLPAEGSARVERYKGKDYMLFDNFYVIMTYNISRDYAFAVSALGDMVVNAGRNDVESVSLNVNNSAGGEEIRAIDTVGGDGAPSGSQAESCGTEICRIQKALKKRGLYNGAIDGSAGPQLQRAIAQWQLQNGLPVDGKITKMLSNKLR